MKQRIARSILGCLAVVVPSSVFAAVAEAYEISSPGNRVKVAVAAVGGTLKLSGISDARTVWQPSAIGITVDGVDLFRDVSLCEKERRVINETYDLMSSETPIYGSASEMILTAVHTPSGYGYDIEVRAADNGIAYRLRLPGAGARKVNREVAEWRLPQEGTAWFAERNSSWKLLTYAGEFGSCPIGGLHRVSQQGPLQMMPLLCELEGPLYLTVTEAALCNYSGMRLEAQKDGSLTANFTETGGFEVNGEILTPWRVLKIDRSLDEVVNSHFITDLAPAADEALFADRSWIRPGRSVWSWWSNIDGSFMTPEGERRMIDRAAELGFEYTTLDEGWEDKDGKWDFVKDLVGYGAGKGVGVFLWRHWNRLNNPDNDYALMASFMDTVATLGVKGLKIDYMNGEDKARIDFGTKALQLAAERRLMVNFHGCQKPTGERRTYPNEITREAVRGLELNRITADYRARMAAKGQPVEEAPHVFGGENQCISAGHDVLLPLTRGAIGATDYTPLGFSMPGSTTAAHHLAMACLVESPLMTMAENPDYLFSEKPISDLIPYILEMPTVWDEVRVLPQTVLGRSLVMAKRKGNDWWVAGVVAGALEADVALDFLEGADVYGGEWISDCHGGDGLFEEGKAELTAGSVHHVGMVANGGFVLKLKKND